MTFNLQPEQPVQDDNESDFDAALKALRKLMQMCLIQTPQPSPLAVSAVFLLPPKIRRKIIRLVENPPNFYRL